MCAIIVAHGYCLTSSVAVESVFSYRGMLRIRLDIRFFSAKLRRAAHSQEPLC
nr:MAG TPA: hypothetical protein [Caudoviricetes sp.]